MPAAGLTSASLAAPSSLIRLCASDRDSSERLSRKPWMDEDGGCQPARAHAPSRPGLTPLPFQTPHLGYVVGPHIPDVVEAEGERDQAAVGSRQGGQRLAQLPGSRVVNAVVAQRHVCKPAGSDGSAISPAPPAQPSTGGFLVTPYLSRYGEGERGA